MTVRELIKLLSEFKMEEFVYIECAPGVNLPVIDVKRDRGWGSGPEGAVIV